MDRATFSAERILIVRLGAIGDVINSTVLVSHLRELYPRAFIAWAVHPVAAPLLEGHPGLDEVVVIPREWFPWHLGKVRDVLAPRRFDLAIDLQKLAKSGLVAWLSGARVRIGYDRHRAKELSWLLSTHRLASRDPQRHVVDQVMEFSSLLGLEAPKARWSLPIRDSDRRLARALGLPARRPHVVVCVGGSEPSKRWFAAGFARLLGELSRRLGVPVLLGGHSEVEKAFAEEIRGLTKAPYLDACGRGEIRDLLGLLEHAGLFIAGDTGPLHLAAAMRVPTIGLFGPQNSNRSGPYGFLRYTVTKRFPCSPCFRPRCPHGTTDCMRAIRFDDVMAVVDRLIQDRGLDILDR